MTGKSPFVFYFSGAVSLIGQSSTLLSQNQIHISLFIKRRLCALSISIIFASAVCMRHSSRLHTSNTIVVRSASPVRF